MKTVNEMGASCRLEGLTVSTCGSSGNARLQTAPLLAALDWDTSGISIFDSSGRLEYVNSAFLGIYALDGDLSSSHVQELALLITPALNSGEDALSCIRPSSTGSSGEERCLASLSNGTKVEVRHRSLPTGGWLSRHVVATDIVDEITPVSELISLQTLIDQVPDYLWVKDVFSRFVVANSALASDHGFAKASDLLGLSDFDLHSAEAAIRFRSIESQILASGEPMIDREERVFDATGQEKWLSSSKTPLRNAMGEVVGLIGVARDITSRKKAEALGRKASELEEISGQLQAALERERQVNALQRQFVSMASHEFRTPLAIIDGAAQRLTRRKEELDASFVADKAQQIRSAVSRMIELMESFLSFGKLDAGKMSLAPTKCSPKDILIDCCARQQELAKHHTISLNVESLPDVITADRAALEQVFTNLLSNAVKYSPAPSAIEVRAWSDEDRIHVSVRDHGIGIDKDDLPKLFERYFRASTSTGIAGTGIGLSLVKQIVELHGGQVSVESKRGEGSTFTVSLPHHARQLASARAEAVATTRT